MAVNPRVEIVIDGDSGPLDRALAGAAGKMKAFDKSIRRVQNKALYSRSLRSIRQMERGQQALNRAILFGAVAWAIFGAAGVAAGLIAVAAVVAIPLAIAGVGIAMAAQSQKVKSAFSDMASDIKAKSAGLAKPLEGPLINLAGKVSQAFDAIAPSLSRMFTALAPVLTAFGNALPAAAAKLGPVLEKGMAAGLPVLEALGKALGGPVLTGLGQMFDKLNNPVVTEFATAFGEALGKVLPILGDLLVALTPVGTAMMNILPGALSAISGAIASVVPYFLQVTDFLVANPGLVKGLAIALLAGAAAFKVINAALTAFRTVMALANLVMMMNPIGLVVIAIIALVAAFVIAYKKSDTFRTIVQKSFAIVKGHATALWNAIKSAFSKITSALGTAASWIKTKMSQAKEGFMVLVNGAISMHQKIVAKVEALIGFVKDIPGKIKGAFGNAVTMLTTVGSNIVAGLRSGISGAWDNLVDWVKGKVDALKSAITKPLEIFSPSRWAARVGGYLAEGMRRGYVSGMDKTIAATKNLMAALKKGKVKEIRKATRATLVAMRADAYETLNELKKQRADYAAAVKDTAKSFAGLSGLQLGENEAMSFGSIKNFLADRLSAISTFNSKLAVLAKKGLSKELYNQIVQMGPEQGTAYAEALAAASPKQLAELNNMQGRINAASTTLGNNTASTMYKAGVDSAQGFVNGLNKRIAVIKKTGTALAKALVKQLKKALGIKSPSKVMAKQGIFAGLGLVEGMNSTVRDIEKASYRMGGAVVNGFGSPDLNRAKFADGVGIGGRTVVITNKFEIKADATTDRVALGKELKKAIKEADMAGARV